MVPLLATTIAWTLVALYRVTVLPILLWGGLTTFISLVRASLALSLLAAQAAGGALIAPQVMVNICRVLVVTRLPVLLVLSMVFPT